MLLRQLFEAIDRTGEGNTAVVGWGRGMGHKGHMMLASIVPGLLKFLWGAPHVSEVDKKYFFLFAKIPDYSW